MKTDFSPLFFLFQVGNEAWSRALVITGGPEYLEPEKRLHDRKNQVERLSLPVATLITHNTNTPAPLAKIIMGNCRLWKYTFLSLIADNKCWRIVHVISGTQHSH